LEPVTSGKVVLLVVDGLALLELGVLLALLPVALEPPQPASATLEATTTRPVPNHLPIVRLLLLLMSLASLLEGGKPFKALQRGGDRTARHEC